MSLTKDDFEAVIGLEIHVQLNTKTKLFSSALNQFGDEPNQNITEVCTGQPGALPVLNKEAIKKALLFGLAVGAKPSIYSSFDRKSYFYPDSPRNFQITQYEHPIIKGGTITTLVEGKEMEFFIEHAHLEDDAGMLKHFSSFAAVDYNRAGAPLLEIVSKPCMHSPKEASSYARAIKAIFQYIGASNCNMEEGHLRIDANISVRPKNTPLRNKTEIKNMNSFHYLELAIEAEIHRQISLYLSHPQTSPDRVIEPGTYRWDPDKKETILMRRKESADDYRYFPEPDLPPVILTEEYIHKVKEELPELPYDRFKRYLSEYTISQDFAEMLTLDKSLSDYFEEALITTKNAKALCNWLLIEFPGKLKDSRDSIITLGMPAKHIADLINLIDEGKITGRIAKDVADVMIQNPTKEPQKIVDENPDFKPLSDTSEIETLVDKVLQENPDSIKDYQSGRTKAFAYLVGQIMKLTRGKASPQIVNELIHKKIKEL